MSKLEEQDNHRATQAREGQRSAAVVHYATFSLAGALRFLSHQQLLTFFSRSVIRAGLPVVFSRGFNPRPRISLPVPKSVGMACSDDLLRIELTRRLDGEELCSKLQEVMPDDLTIHRAWSTDIRTFPQADTVEWDVDLTGLDVGDLDRRVRGILNSDTFWVSRTSHKRRATTTLNLRAAISDIRITETALRAVVSAGSAGGIRVGEFLVGLGLPMERGLARVSRTAVRWTDQGFASLH